MIYRFRWGWHIFTASSQKRSRRFVHFCEGLDWVFTQKLAASCADEWVANHE
ncbi:hypothetical protein SAMN05518863_106174 [Candidatus Pantoea symbiotica]|uniref:Uncharacterized protein n=1 Tax=Candidatus Pantoea symbiotica TaxID=1884370 RepID=A0A1I3YQ96_9GAMM|nr:hypothetical protein SAMN05518863_106174 [Pantoea symbiotica]SFU86850.1 hypothetical protein SAMN05518864_106173 [Pantoea sp. YR525]